MPNPIRFEPSSGEYFVWLTRFGVKYMKYFPTGEDALEYVRNNPRLCMELSGIDAISDAWVSEARERRGFSEAINQKVGREKVEFENEIRKNSKARLVYGVDTLAALPAFSISQALGVGGAVPIVLVGGILIYASSRVTQKVSESKFSVATRVAIYTGLCLLYFSSTGLIFATKNALQ